MSGSGGWVENPGIERPQALTLWVALGTLIASIALLALLSPAASVVGYLLCPIGVAVLVSWYRRTDILRQSSPWYLASQAQRRLAASLLFGSFVVGCAHAWIIATAIAKAVA